MKKRVLSLALAASMATSMLPTVSLAAGTTQFGDTKGHWAENSIDRWSEYKIVEGYEGNFNPDADLTRGQMAKIIANTMGLTEEAENPFADLDTSAWYAPYILRCYEAGIMQGDGTNANPDNTITRAETMTLLGRALGITPIDNADLSTYGDASDVASWAKGYVAAMVEAGIINGTSDGLLAPNLAINRATIMTILDRSITQYINAPGTYELAADGLVLVACGGVTLTGKSAANLIVTPGASGEKVTFKKAEITGSITVQGDNVKVISNNSKLPTINATGSGVTVSKPSSGGGGSSSGGNTDTTPDDTIITTETYTLDKTSGLLTVTAAAVLDGNTIKTENEVEVKNIVIADTVGEGTVELANFNVDDLTVNGGGNQSIKLKNFVANVVKMAKTVGEQMPRLFLEEGAEIKTEVVIAAGTKGAIIEAKTDVKVIIPKVTASANVYVAGKDTQITTVYTTGNDTVDITVSNATIGTVEAKSDKTYITGDDTATVGTVVAEKPVEVESKVVEVIEVTASVTVEIKGTDSITVTVNTTAKVEVKTEENNDVSFEKGENVKNETVDVEVTEGDKEPEKVEHFCEFVEDESQYVAPTCTAAGKKVYKCTDKDCTKTKEETIVALGHEMSAWEVTTKATCTAQGMETRHCTRNGCSYEETRETAIDKNAHNAKDEWVYVTGEDTEDFGYHWHNCANGCDTKLNKAEHTYAEGGNVCTVCGFVKPGEGSGSAPSAPSDTPDTGDKDNKDDDAVAPEFSIEFHGCGFKVTNTNDTDNKVTIKNVIFTKEGETEGESYGSHTGSYTFFPYGVSPTTYTVSVTYTVSGDETVHTKDNVHTVEVKNGNDNFTYTNRSDTANNYELMSVYTSSNDTKYLTYTVGDDTNPNTIKFKMQSASTYYVMSTTNNGVYYVNDSTNITKAVLTDKEAKLYSVTVITNTYAKTTTFTLSKPVTFVKQDNTTNP